MTERKATRFVAVGVKGKDIVEGFGMWMDMDSQLWVLVGLAAGSVGAVALAWLLFRPSRCLACYLFFLPLELYIAPDWHLTFNQVLQGGLVLLLLGVLGSKRRSESLGIVATCMGVFWGFLVLSLLWTLDAAATGKTVVRVGLAMASAILLMALVKDWKQWVSMTSALLLGSGVMAIYGFVQYIRKDFDAIYPFFSPYYNTDLWLDRGGGFAVVSTFPNPNTLALFGVMLVPIALSRVKGEKGYSLFWFLSLLAITGVTALTFSKTAWILIAALLLLWLVVRCGGSMNVMVWGALIVCACVVIPYLDRIQGGYDLLFPSTMDRSVGPRLILWSLAYDAFLARPFFGWGPLAFAAVTESARDAYGLSPLVHAHNLYLQSFADMGVIGVGLYLGPFIVTLICGFIALRRAATQGLPADRQRLLLGICLALVGFILGGLGDCLLLSNQYVNLQWICLALLASAIRLIRRDGQQRKDLAHES